MKLEIFKTKAPNGEELYRMCIKTKLGSGISNVEEIMNECKKLKINRERRAWLRDCPIY